MRLDLRALYKRQAARALSLCALAASNIFVFVHHTPRARTCLNHTHTRIGYTQFQHHTEVIRDARSDRVNMAQPDISSILAALGKYLRALPAWVFPESTRLTIPSSSAKPGCYTDLCDTATGAAEPTSTRRLPRRGANPECPSARRIPSTAN